MRAHDNLINAIETYNAKLCEDSGRPAGSDGAKEGYELGAVA